MTVLQRLQSVDERLATKVSRNKIGSLVGRLYFTPDGEDQAEVSIFRFIDQGITSEPWAVGTEQVGHRYAIRVNRAWWDENGETQGKYHVQLSDELTEQIPVIVENQVIDDNQTYVAMTFRVQTTVTPEISILG